jgi:hypothetical protein
MKPLRFSPFQRHDGTWVWELALSDGFRVQTIVVNFGAGHAAAIQMNEWCEKARCVANDALRDAPRPGGKS